jgi:hypothetical protein
MAFKYSKGAQVIGDLKAQDDTQRDTQIDFGEDQIEFQTSGSTRMKITNSETIFTHTVHISGSDIEGIRLGKGDANYKQIVFETDGADGANIQLSNAENLVIMNETNGKDIQFWTNPSAASLTQQMVIEEGGNIGIGTSSPGTNLHVKGDDARVRIDGDTDSHPGLELSENGTRKWIVYNNYTNDNLTFKTNSNIRMSIEQDGNVGIGTASPVATLTVNGSMATKITSINNSHSPYSITATDHIILADSFGGAITINLPACSSNSGRIIIVKDVGAGAGSNNITISRNGSDQIDGSVSIAIDTNRGYVQLVSDGSQFWHQIAKEGVS